jgi:hypothetical protein
LARIVKGCCRTLQVLSPGESDKAVSQILPLKQNEDYEYHNDAGSREGMDQRSDQAYEHLKCTRVRLPQFHGDRLV